MSLIPHNTNIRLMKMMTIIQDLKREFTKYVETLNLTQAGINVELKNSITELENSRESLKSQMNQREDKDSKIKYRN